MLLIANCKMEPLKRRAKSQLLIPFETEVTISLIARSKHRRLRMLPWGMSLVLIKGQGECVPSYILLLLLKSNRSTQRYYIVWGLGGEEREENTEK